MHADTGREGSVLVPDPAPASLCARFQDSAARYRDRIAFTSFDGSFADITWGEYARNVEETAGALAAMGVGPGDCVALLFSTRPEFHWFDLAALHLGARTVSVYNTAPPQFIEYLLTNSGARVLVTERAYGAQAEQAAGLIEHVAVIDEAPGGRHAWADHVAATPADFDFEARWRQVSSSDLATMIYTSGTTGVSKGVQLTHGNILWAVGTYMERMGLPFGSAQMSYLPMAHIAARNMDHYGQILRGFEMTLLTDHSEVLDGMLKVRPGLFFSPPRMWEKLRSRIQAEIAAQDDPARRAELTAALERGLERVRRDEKPDEAEIAVMRDIRALVGLDRIAAAIIGGAPVARELMEFFHAVGVPLGESYGMSENGGVCTTNPPDGVRFGTIGVPLDGQEVRLADDGEILVKGPGVMVGYRDMPEATAEAIDGDGWLHTGDIATRDADGYLTIVDRKKELIINAAGKNMSPVLIEGELRKHGRLLSTAVAIGEGRPYLVALLTLDPDALATHCADNGIEPAPLEELATDARILAVVEQDVETANQGLSRVEQIKRFHIVTDTWTPGGNEVTSTLKIRRKGVADRYQEEIRALYDRRALAGSAG
ncbi:AMP-dependent synthetase/ligase [Rhodococcus sp. T7]|uniref:AMP-dependent synthetase/ligase n=1 Tax=Rhodococcus sp. T7 TaxID=627444 RepID=UPI00135A5CB5|nr:AMP-dependent synthetase/ligase [Rhodococcus sp. T7]KAF0956787.1 Long-chain-fatty-acid--CoA ligase FadD15 [Rhodococcus sp. T7]KAF0966074.1 Long-chain-fatty-acid--CoA ligase FadD15 [Rhodococcus sp. T7]